MPDLSDYRAQIDEIDGQITRLLERRMRVVEGVARYKLEKGMPVLQPEREAQVIEKQVARLENPENAGAVRGLYAEIMRSSRLAQMKLIGQAKDEPLPELRDWVEHPRAAYPGVPGSFSEQAALDFFGDSAQISHFDQFEQVCQAVKAGEVDYGVLPIENSSTGAVTDSYDLLDRYELYIVGEQLVKIEQHLMALPGTRLEEIREVYSHAQGIAQSSVFLKEHPEWRVVPYLNTAISAKMVRDSGDRTRAAIAAERAARLYGLEILQRNVNFSRNNNTRFVIVSRHPMARPGADKASVSFTLENRVGTLSQVLSCFAAHGINMSRIESRPIAGKPWEYDFYADFEGAMELERIREALSQARQDTRMLRLLGIYRKAAHEEA